MQINEATQVHSLNDISSPPPPDTSVFMVNNDIKPIETTQSFAIVGMSCRFPGGKVDP